MQLLIANQNNIDTSIKNLEMQVGKIEKQLVDQQQGTFTADTQTNPGEHDNAITTRCEEVINKGVNENS